MKSAQPQKWVTLRQEVTWIPGGGGDWWGVTQATFSCCFLALRCAADPDVRMRPGAGLRPPYPGGLAVIISSDVGDARQEIAPAPPAVPSFALMGCGGMPRRQPGRKRLRAGESGGGHGGNLAALVTRRVGRSLEHIWSAFEPRGWRLDGCLRGSPSLARAGRLECLHGERPVSLFCTGCFFSHNLQRTDCRSWLFGLPKCG